MPACETLTLPPVREIIGGRPTAEDLRNVDVADLLGRRPVELDMAVIAEQIAGKRVLVTGAGGSIGSELCRQIARFGPERLFLLDRDESGLQETQLSLVGNGLLDSDDLILANIREADAMLAAFERARPDIVFHAAALKHLPLLESHPLEAWKTNVLGTLQRAAGRRRGRCGHLRQHLDRQGGEPDLRARLQQAARRAADGRLRQPNFPGRYVSVRFGNVLGSRGSVVHAFTAQIQRGGPITVTHPDVERYFMLIPEACQLVLEAASIGSDGEVMVLDMGEQVKIVDVAQTLIRMSGSARHRHRLHRPAAGREARRGAVLPPRAASRTPLTLWSPTWPCRHSMRDSRAREPGVPHSGCCIVDARREHPSSHSLRRFARRLTNAFRSLPACS